ncbi:MAG: Ubiquinone biosynthesis O-methyltransferase [Anaerolineae bacterium]|nr:Ubiquinone biosynthesis O-methyltransferase [Anaerolineae bacterium]
MGLTFLYTSGDEENRKAILSLVSPQPGCHLLDCGCADGAFTLRIAQSLQTSNVYGIETHTATAKLSQEKNIVVSSSNLNSGLNFGSDFFDVVHANQVIEHLIETDLFVQEIYRVLKPGGYAIISTNNMASWHNIISLALGMQPMPNHASNEIRLGNILDPTHGKRHPHRGAIHWRIFAFAALQELFDYHGFKPVCMMTSVYYPFPNPLSTFLCKIDKWHGAYLIVKAHKPFKTGKGLS